MSQLTAEELRALPKKDEWSPDEALALYEVVDGFELCCRAPTPFYVGSTTAVPTTLWPLLIRHRASWHARWHVTERIAANLRAASIGVVA